MRSIGITIENMLFKIEYQEVDRADIVPCKGRKTNPSDDLSEYVLNLPFETVSLPNRDDMASRSHWMAEKIASYLQKAVFSPCSDLVLCTTEGNNGLMEIHLILICNPRTLTNLIRCLILNKRS